MNVTVSVYCEECESDDSNDGVEMIGAGTMNQGIRSQSRLYTCPECGHRVTVVLEPRRDERPELHKGKVESIGERGWES